MVPTKLIVENIMKIIPEFEYQFSRPMKKITQKELTNYQSKVLTVLYVVPEISMSELADRLVMAKPQLTANVDVLVNLGFIERTSDSSDRRKIIIRIRPEGELYLAHTKQRICDFYDQYYDTLTEEERLELYMSMEKLLKLLEKLNPLAYDAKVHLVSKG